MSKSLYRHMVSFLFDKYLEGEWLDDMWDVRLTFYTIANCFPKWMRNLTSCEQSNRVSVSLFLYQYFIWSVFLLLAISVSLYSHYIVLIWFLLWLMRWNLNSCSYLPHDCLSSSLKHLSNLLSIFNWIFLFCVDFWGIYIFLQGTTSLYIFLYS